MKVDEITAKSTYNDGGKTRTVYRIENGRVQYRDNRTGAIRECALSAFAKWAKAKMNG